MIHYLLRHQDLSVKNLVVSLDSLDNMKALEFMNLQDVIVKDIQKHLKEKKSVLLEYFIGGRKIQKLFVFIDKEKNYQSQVLFLGTHFPKLPNDLAIYCIDGQKTSTLLEVCELSRYKFQTYKTKKEELKLEILTSLEDKKILQEKEALVESIILARDLGERSACDLTPEVFAQEIKKMKFKNIKVTILSYKDIQKKWLWLLEAVGKGSVNKPCMVILEHIKDKKNPIHGIVWKWVTFDTGWNQIKPGDYMYDMKGDMWWAAVALWVMKELDRRKSNKNVVACLMLAENVVSDSSFKPSDVITWYTWKTVEVIHTDAEGRLVLADGISYLGKKYKTKTMMTIATLTWACMVALWYRYAGIMGTDEKMIDSILEYSKEHTEKYIRLPFDDLFVEKTKSKIADFNNLERSVHAGSSMGAAFLYNFLENNESYTHIDIAGTYINGWDAYGKMPKGMTGFGVESLSEIFSS